MRRPMNKPRRIKRLSLDGILLLDKPAGLSSNAALQKVKRLYRAEKAGHTGSLDPFATGLLPICFGQGTKLCGYLLDADKRYRARVRLGEKTATGDIEGEIIERSDAATVSAEQIAAAMPALLGDIEQIPPMYSAIKREGRHLYELAREGITIDRAPRRVRIHELRLLEVFEQGFDFEVRCSKGTYVRTLAEDWAAAFGQCGHLTQLHRLETGPFTAAHMVSAERLESLADDATALHALLRPLASAMVGWPTITVDDTDAARLRRGLICGPYAEARQGQAIIVNAVGQLYFIAEVDAAGRVAPKRWLGPELAES